MYLSGELPHHGLPPYSRLTRGRLADPPFDIRARRSHENYDTCAARRLLEPLRPLGFRLASAVERVLYISICIEYAPTISNLCG